MKGDTITVYRVGQEPEVIPVDNLPETPDYFAIKRVVAPHLDEGDMERVNVFWGGRYTDMFVDGEGIEKGLPVNDKATEVYHNNLRVHAPDQLGPNPSKIFGPAVLFSRKVWS